MTQVSQHVFPISNADVWIQYPRLLAEEAGMPVQEVPYSATYYHMNCCCTVGQQRAPVTFDI